MIELVEVVKSTEKTVTIVDGRNGRERRSAIKSEYGSYFRTWEEAHAHLLERAESKVVSIRSQLESANGYLGNIRGLKRPA